MQGTGTAVCLPADIDTDVVIPAGTCGPGTGVSGQPTSSRISTPPWPLGSGGP